MASRRNSHESSASEASEASSSSVRTSSSTWSRSSPWSRRSSLLDDLLNNEKADSPIEFICIPGVGGSRLMKPDESGVDREIYPALWECIKGRAEPSNRMILKEGDGSYASEVLCRIAHIPNWVPHTQLKKLGAAETHMWAYDWRRDAERPSGTRFIVLAHSYGGLVTVDALSQLHDADLIAGVMTFGSPFQGTYKVHTVRRQGFSIFNWIPVYTPEVYQSFAAIWLITPGCSALTEWRERVKARKSSVLEQTRFVCVTGKADTLNAEAEDVVDGMPPESALGDGTVTVTSATDPPGVKPIAKLTSDNHHVILANCETSIREALRLIMHVDEETNQVKKEISSESPSSHPRSSSFVEWLLAMIPGFTSSKAHSD